MPLTDCGELRSDTAENRPVGIIVGAEIYKQLIYLILWLPPGPPFLLFVIHGFYGPEGQGQAARVRCAFTDAGVS